MWCSNGLTNVWNYIPEYSTDNNMLFHPSLGQGPLSLQQGMLNYGMTHIQCFSMDHTHSLDCGPHPQPGM